MTDIVLTLAGAVNVATLVIAVFGGFYATKTLRLLRNNTELANQKVVWVPILISVGLFAITAALYVLILIVPMSEPELGLIFSLFRGSAFFFLSIAVFRYWRMTGKFDNARKRVLEAQE